MIVSFIIRYVDWQTGIRVFVPDSDYPFTGLLPRNAQLAFLDSSAFTKGLRSFLGIVAVAIRLYLVECQSAIGPIGHFDWDGP